MNKHIPIIEQYLKIKNKHKTKLVLYQMGDFYELFYNDAKKAAKILNIVLTNKGISKNKKIPMAGFPIHASEYYIKKLIEENQKIVICEQVENLNNNTKLIERKITKIITPGTITEEIFLNEKEENFIMSIYNKNKKYGISKLNITSGELVLMEINNYFQLIEEIKKTNPKEIISFTNIKIEKEKNIKINFQKKKSFFLRYEISLQILKNHFNINSLKPFGCEDLNIAIISAAGLFQYLKEIQIKELNHIKTIKVENSADNIQMNYTTRKNLEISRNINGEKKNTILSIIDKTKTTMGSRLLSKWINNPIRNKNIINSRLEKVEYLKKNKNFLYFENELKNVSDIERIISRIGMLNAKPKDLIMLKKSLNIIPKIKKKLEKKDLKKKLLTINNKIHNLESITKILQKSIKEKNITSNNEHIIKKGFNKDLDILKEKNKNSKQNLIEIEIKEKKNTGIKNLKIKFKKNNGYFIEINEKEIKKIPKEYKYIKSLKNVNRYTTEELEKIENEISNNKNLIKNKEKNIIKKIMLKIICDIKKIQETKDAISELDVLTSFAEIAELFNWTKPIISNKNTISIKSGKHPTIENIKKNEFISNNLTLNNKKKTMIITGPNMGGKSTYIRQNALIIVLANSGSFVPAKKALICDIDKIFTRIGASDNIVEGNSTFMLEMIETAYILNNATNKSIVLLDEIGRGTGNNEGISIAWAITQNLTNKNKCFTLFATHYFHVSKLEKKINKITNFHFNAIKKNGKLIFFYKIKKGASKKHFSLEVAQLAGISDEIIKNAKIKLKELEENERN